MKNTQTRLNSYCSSPDESGHFGMYGGRFVAETLMPLILALEDAYAKAKSDPEFQKELDYYLSLIKEQEELEKAIEQSKLDACSIKQEDMHKKFDNYRKHQKKRVVYVKKEQ